MNTAKQKRLELPNIAAYLWQMPVVRKVVDRLVIVAVGGLAIYLTVMWSLPAQTKDNTKEIIALKGDCIQHHRAIDSLYATKVDERTLNLILAPTLARVTIMETLQKETRDDVKYIREHMIMK